MSPMTETWSLASTSPGPSAKRIGYNRNTPPTYNTLRMLHKRTTDTPMVTKRKRRRRGDVEVAYQEHQTQARECTPRKPKAQDMLDHQPPTKRQTNTTHRSEQHALDTQGNIRYKGPYEAVHRHPSGRSIRMAAYVPSARGDPYGLTADDFVGPPMGPLRGHRTAHEALAGREPTRDTQETEDRDAGGS